MATRSSSLFRIDRNAAVSPAPLELKLSPPPALALDYSEVFGRVHGEGVPVLKLPVLDQDGEKEPPFDLGPVDYAEVFGGYDDWSFAASYEDVFGKSEAFWTQLEAPSSPEKQSSDFDRPSSLSDHGITSECKKDNVNIILDTEERVSETGSQSNGTFVTISGMNLRTHPSKCPPPSRQPPFSLVQNEDSYRLNGKSGGSKIRRYSFQGTESSANFYEEEVDASSSAAASAAAMLDAMEKARAKLNSAKEIMERKKEGLSYRSKPCQKNSLRRSDIDIYGSSKPEENLAQEVESQEKFFFVGGQNVTNTAETVLQSREEKKLENVVRKFVRKGHKQGSWSCGDSETSVGGNGEAAGVYLFDMAKSDERKRPVEAGRYEVSREITENVRGEKEVQCYEADKQLKKKMSTNERTRDNKMLQIEKCNARDDEKMKKINIIACEQEKPRQMKIDVHHKEQSDQGLKSTNPKLEETGFELKEEACIGEQKLKRVLLSCDRAENMESTKEPYGSKPLRSLCELKENQSFEISPGRAKLDPNAGVVGTEVDRKIKPGFNDDTFELRSLEKIISVSVPMFEVKGVVLQDEKIKAVMEDDIRMLDLGENDGNSGAAAAEPRASQPRMFSESNYLQEKVINEVGEKAVYVCNDGRKLPEMVDLVTKHLGSDEVSRREEKTRQDQLKKLENERDREREKDSLVVDKPLLHQVLEKAGKAAVLKPKELQGESPQRCKARLERQQRTAKRAATALAEKNTRDLAALREQAERNRLADSLGAEVKRWAAGKEGNLRALLSTLQYILGPESGWKPIPLTDVITPVDAKKAYRKATLHVHPDKVQQRGANVQQKFICDKIFDLLKDAWNRFNSEER